MTFVVNIIVRAAYRYVVPMFFRTIKRFPPLVAGLAMGGQTLGGWLVYECGKAEDWPMVGLGVLMLGGYTGLLGLVAVKWADGTWGEFCDYVMSLVE